MPRAELADPPSVPRSTRRSPWNQTARIVPSDDTACPAPCPWRLTAYKTPSTGTGTTWYSTMPTSGGVNGFAPPGTASGGDGMRLSGRRTPRVGDPQHPLARRTGREGDGVPAVVLEHRVAVE